MQNDLDILASFVPDTLLRRIVSETLVPDQAMAHAQDVAALYADLSGFTKLMASLSGSGARGSEQASQIVNRCFQALIGAVLAHGGDLVTVSGDAVLAIWPTDGEHSLADAARQASVCAIACRDAVENLDAHDGHKLRVKVVVAAGEALLMDVGGVADRWLYLVAGTPLRNIARIGVLPEPGEVLVHASAWDLVRDAAQGSPKGEAHVLRQVEPGPWPERPKPELTPELIPILRPWVAPTVLHRLDAGQTEWLAELRSVSVVFINVPDVDLSDRRMLAALNRAIRVVQSNLVRFEGAFQDLVQDDKGVVMMASFGIPPYSHENNALRAVRAAMEIQRELRQLQLQHGLGIATGQVFCGFYGNAQRRQHAVVGAPVNRAARIMQEARGDLLCDEETAKQAGERIHFAAQSPIRLKGFPDPVTPLRPLWTERRTAPATRRSAGEDTSVIGRRYERRALSEALDALEAHQRSGVIILEGEAGIGKSMLITHLIAEARGRPVRTLVGLGDEVEAHEPWFALRPVVEDLLELGNVLDPEERRRVVRHRLEASTALSEWAPLVNGILALGLPENDITRQMAGAMRSDGTVDLVVHLLGELAVQTPVLLIMDDAHWMDSATWSFIRAARRRVAPLLIVVATRPGNAIDAGLEELLQGPDAQHLTLEHLETVELAALLADRLAVSSVDPALVEVVQDRSGGNPFFAEELAYALREGTHLRVSGDQCSLVATREQINHVVAEGSVAGIVTSRLDRLPASQQLLLKVASVLGRVFSLEALRTLHREVAHHDLVTDLDELIDTGLLHAAEDGAHFWFRHVITEQAAYSLVTYAQRQILHAAAARYLEASNRTHQAAGLGLMAHHCRRAEQHERALHYLERAAASALHEGANREAIEYLEQVRQLVDDHEDTLGRHLGPRREAKWSKITGQARLALGDLEGAHVDLGEALRRLDAPIPQSRAGMLIGLLFQLVRQVMHLLGLLRTARHGPNADRLSEAARAASLYSQVRYFSTDIPGWVHACLHSLNLAERAGNSPAAGRAYGGLGNLVATVGLERLAKRYFARAQECEDAGGLLTSFWARSVASLTSARWVEAREAVSEGLALAARVGHRYEEGIGMTISAYLDFLEARLSAALVGYKGVLSSARQRDNSQHEGWALTLMVPTLIELDRADSALKISREAADRMERADPLTLPIHHGTAALALQHTGHRREALREAREALALFRSADPVYTYIPGYVGMIEVLLDHWRAARGTDRAESKQLAKEVAQAVSALRSFARLFAIARPRTLLYDALAAGIAGRTHKAEKLLRASVESAARYSLRRDEGRARYELAKLLGKGSPDAQAQLDRARELFEASEARYYLKEVELLAQA